MSVEMLTALRHTRFIQNLVLKIINFPVCIYAVYTMQSPLLALRVRNIHLTRTLYALPSTSFRIWSLINELSLRLLHKKSDLSFKKYLRNMYFDNDIYFLGQEYNVQSYNRVAFDRLKLSVRRYTFSTNRSFSLTAQLNILFQLVKSVCLETRRPFQQFWKIER